MAEKYIAKMIIIIRCYFRSEKEQKQVLEDVTGKVDIVIGTHRLLGKDVVFLNLGLLVVDEEQRFGVTHKERLKQLRNEVDVLTMTATPIPRTLHMSLVNVRDMDDAGHHEDSIGQSWNPLRVLPRTLYEVRPRHL